MMNMFMASLIIPMFLFMIFNILEKKESWNNLTSTSFECGFSSYFYSRFSFSIHYFMIGLIFLFLDLELCVFTPFLNEIMPSMVMELKMIIFIMILLTGLLVEWKNNKIEWLK